MIIAYIIAKFDEEENKKIDWLKLIEGGIFEFFHRTMLTDLKPEVYHEIMSKKKKELNKWVLENLIEDVSKIGPEFLKRLELYLFDDEYAKYEKRILAASHEFSTRWEFGVIYPLNQMLYGIHRTKETVENCVSKYQDFAGVKNLVMNKKYYGFLDLCGQLRFQQRWAQSFRQPKPKILVWMSFQQDFGNQSKGILAACSRARMQPSAASRGQVGLATSSSPPKTPSG